MQFTIDCRHCPTGLGPDGHGTKTADSHGVDGSSRSSGCQHCVLTVAADAGRGPSAVVGPEELAAVRRLQRAGMFGSLERVTSSAA